MCQMWVRNGLQIKGQAMTYIQCHFSNSMVDADIFLLQLCCSRLEPALMLQTVLDRFHVLPWLSLEPVRREEREREGPRLVEPVRWFFLCLIAGLLVFWCNFSVVFTPFDPGPYGHFWDPGSA